MIAVTSSIEIERPADEVFAFVSDFPSNPRWQRGMRSCEWTSPGPLRAGSTYDQRARFLGRDIVNAFEVLEFEPGRRVRFASTSGSFPIRVTRTVAPLGERRSRFTEAVEGDAGGFYRLGEGLLRRLVARSIRRDQPKLKALLEAR